MLEKRELEWKENTVDHSPLVILVDTGERIVCKSHVSWVQVPSYKEREGPRPVQKPVPNRPAALPKTLKLGK